MTFELERITRQAGPIWCLTVLCAREGVILFYVEKVDLAEIVKIIEAYDKP